MRPELVLGRSTTVGPGVVRHTVLEPHAAAMDGSASAMDLSQVGRSQQQGICVWGLFAESISNRTTTCQ